MSEKLIEGLVAALFILTVPAILFFALGFAHLDFDMKGWHPMGRFTLVVGSMAWIVFAVRDFYGR